MRKLVLGRIGSEKELEKEAFRMAAGGEKGCKLARDETLHEELRQLWRTWLERQGIRDEKLLTVAEGQPLYLRLLRALLD